MVRMNKNMFDNSIIQVENKTSDKEIDEIRKAYPSYRVVKKVICDNCEQETDDSVVDFFGFISCKNCSDDWDEEIK